MNDSTELPQPNIPLLRKAVEWAEAEAAKTDGTGLWNQGDWISKTTCGTSYCIAGYAVTLAYGPVEVSEGDGILRLPGEQRWLDWESFGAKTLGLTYDEAGNLFDGNNSIADVRRAAEEIAARAGERL